MAAILTGFRHGAGNFIGIDPTVGGGLSEIALTTIGMSGVRTTFLAFRKALVDPVTIGLVQDDENATVSPCCRPGQERQAGQNR